MTHVIKRSGKSEPYMEQKVFASIYASCLAVHAPKSTAESVASQVTKAVNNWLIKKGEITTHDIRKEVGKYLSNLEPHAGYFYLHHRIMW
jgi:transcriptional regulator NrdR family protein